MRSTRKVALVAGSALALALAAPVGAHPQGGSGQGCGQGMVNGMSRGHDMDHGMGMGGGMSMGHGMGMGVLHGNPHDIGDRLDALKSSLKITDAQQPAWQGFADSTKKQAQDRLAWMEKMHTAQVPQSAPERLALHNETMKQRQTDNEAVASSLKTLYDVLTPEQRATLDRGQDARAQRYSRR